jgi:hypothetical protein
MAQIDAKTLDNSPLMKEFFQSVKQILTKKHHYPSRDADALIDRFFSHRVDALERALVMHRDPEDVADELAG